MNLDEHNINADAFPKSIFKDYKNSFLNKFELLPSEIGLNIHSMGHEQDLALHSLNFSGLFYELFKLHQMWDSRIRYILDSFDRILASVRDWWPFFSRESSFLDKDPLTSGIRLHVEAICFYVAVTTERDLRKEASPFIEEILKHFNSGFLYEPMFFSDHYKHINQYVIICVLVVAQLIRESILLLEPAFDALNYELNRVEIKAHYATEYKLRGIYKLCYTIKPWIKEVKELTDGIVLFQDLYLSICFLFINKIEEKSVKIYNCVLKNVGDYQRTLERDHGHLAEARRMFFRIQERFILLNKEYDMEKEKIKGKALGYGSIKMQLCEQDDPFQKQGISLGAEYRETDLGKVFRKKRIAFIKEKRAYEKAQRMYEIAQIKSDGGPRKGPRDVHSFNFPLSSFTFSD